MNYSPNILCLNRLSARIFSISRSPALCLRYRYGTYIPPGVVRQSVSYVAKNILNCGR
jgi:hypothetical protein